MKYFTLIPVLFLFVSCSVSHRVASVIPVDSQAAMAGAVHNKSMPAAEAPVATKAVFQESALTPEPVNVDPEPGEENAVTASAAVKSNHKAHSFAEMKQMVAKGEIVMSKSDRKTLAKLDRNFKGDFRQFRQDSGGFELTTTTKIIGIIGIVSLVIALFGSWFFAFVFLLAVAAFLLKWFHIIEF